MNSIRIRMSGKTKCRCVVVNYEQLSYHFIGTLEKNVQSCCHQNIYCNCINKLSIKFQIHIRRAAARIFLAKNTKSNDPLSQLVGYAN